MNHLALLIISQSGLRADECIALKYEGLDFLHKMIRVDESWDSYHSMIKESKTKNIKRTLPILPKIMQILENWIHYHRKVLCRNGMLIPITSYY